MKYLFFIFYLFFLISNETPGKNKVNNFEAENNSDSISVNAFNCSSLIIPGILLGYGIIGIESDGLKIINSEVQEEVHEHIDERLTLDDYMQYMPMITGLWLDRFRIKAEHDLRDRLVILSTSYILMGGMTNSLKYSTHIQRPDGTSFNSFPSGHTATAFMGAEFLWQEYKGSTPWPGILGYTLAGATGIYRVLNDRHWTTDVAAGAGVGILSTKAAYWLHPYMKKIFGLKNKKRKSLLHSVSVIPWVSKSQNYIFLSMYF
jgi:hypothetical protein